MIRSVEFDLETRTPNAIRFASKRGQRAHAEWIKRQRKAVRDVLQAHFTAPTPFYFDATKRANVPLPNRIRVHFTRIAAGTLDPEENLPMAFKHVKDEVAEWCGFKNDRDPIFSWVVPYGQRKADAHVQRVRIEITDESPGAPRVVVLAEKASAGRAAKARVKRAVKEATKMNGVTRTGRVLTYQPEAGARAASSAARQRAEGAFAKLTGKPTALDLRDAAERALAPATSGGARSRGAPSTGQHGAGLDGAPQRVPHRDPGEERPARDLAPCEVCGAPTGSPCRFFGGDKGINGVHPQRAKAAGINGVRLPSRAPTNGHRRIVPPAQAPLPLPAAYVRLPWELVPCAACVLGCASCGGRGTKGPVRRDARHDGEHAPAAVVYTVPAEHRARFGDRVTLTRRRTTLPKIGDVWLYE